MSGMKIKAELYLLPCVAVITSKEKHGTLQEVRVEGGCAMCLDVLT